jgi:uncharacterized membrane protein
MIIAGASALVGVVLVVVVNAVSGTGRQSVAVSGLFLPLGHRTCRGPIGPQDLHRRSGWRQQTHRLCAVSNTVIGVVLLLAGSIGALTAILPLTVVILVLAAMGISGAILSARLPEVT